MEKDQRFPFYYVIFNLLVGSDIELPECFRIEKPEAKLDFVIQVVDSVFPLEEPVLAKSYYQISPKDYFLDLGPLAHFRVSSGTNIQIQLLTQNRLELVRRYLLSRVFAVMLYQRKLYPLAASAIYVNGNGLLLSGSSAYAQNILPQVFNRRFQLISPLYHMMEKC